LLVFRIARAFSQRPNDVRGWDFYEEFLPACENLGEIPIVDELIKVLVDGLTKTTKDKKTRNKFVKPLTTAEERQKAFDDLLKRKEA
jgi:hypothetical protein